MGICGEVGSSDNVVPSDDWTRIRNYFLKLNDKLGGNRKHPIKYN